MSQAAIQVLKFGGSSVSGRWQWQFIADLCGQRIKAGKQLVLVCSAVSGCTDLLERMVVAAELKNSAGVVENLNRYMAIHHQLASDLDLDFVSQLTAHKVSLEALLNQYQWDTRPGLHAQIVASGEIISSLLGESWLRSQEIPLRWQAATSLLTCASPVETNWRAYLQASAEASRHCHTDLFCARTPVVITQGFVAASPAGETCLLGRGGSDISAILMVAGLGLAELEIFSDVPGIYTANPHYCAEACLLLELDYSEALEISAAGAGVIHPRAVRCGEDHGLQIKMRQTGASGALGTLIRAASKSALSSGPVKAISCREKMLALLLENRDQNRQVGFLAEVFTVFSSHGLAIEQVATSETTTTVSLQQSENRIDAAKFEKLAADLQPLCKLTLLPPATALTIIGRGIRSRFQAISQAIGELAEKRLLMASVSANDTAYTLLVPEADSQEHLRNLHKALIAPDLDLNKAIFGPVWSDFKAVGRLAYRPAKCRVFHFSSCRYDARTGIAKLGYRFDRHAEFYETIQFLPANKLDAAGAEAFENALQILHLIAGISYYKAGIPALLKINTLAEDEQLRKFLQELYQQGLAEFAHRNQVDLSSRLQFEFCGLKTLSAQNLPAAPAHDLLAMGGGKDSLVAAEMLKTLQRPFTTVAVGGSELIEATARLTGHEFIRIGRQLAPQLEQMNAAGAYNGHVPVTAINAAILVCQALLSAYGEVIFANEASASSPNLYNDQGAAVNHQYSKGQEYEQMFAQLLRQKVADQPGCFSLLRPWRELAIVEKFSQYPQYFSAFSSCNRNFHLQGSRIAGRWCGDCPKCRFACLMLSLWLPREQVSAIIGRDMLADAGQIEGFAQLCGFQGHKPFECVGEVAESCVAVLQLAGNEVYAGSPVIAVLWEYVEPISAELPSMQEMLKALPESSLPGIYQNLTG